MVTEDEVRRRYRNYVDDYPENTGIVFESEHDTPYPLQDRALGGNTFAGVYRNQFADESSYLFELDSRVPRISELDEELLLIVGSELVGALMIQVTHDHIAFWEYVSSILEGLQSESDKDIEHLADLYNSVQQMSAPPSGTRNKPDSGLQQDILAAYLAYPLLEAVAKWVGQTAVKMNGKVRSGHTIESYNGRVYDGHADGKQANTCSNVGALVWHIEDELGNDRLQNELEITRDLIARLYGESKDEVYGNVLYANRNQSLHGHDKAPAEFGVILTLCGILITSKYLGYV